MTVTIPSQKKLGEFKSSIKTLIILLILSIPGIIFFISIPIPLIPSILFYSISMVGLGICIRVQEKRHSLKEILVSIGFRREGILKSILWAIACLTPYVLLASLIFGQSLFQYTAQIKLLIPTWMIISYILYVLFFVAAFEESFFRGYLLDRFMPEHPSSISKAFPAILLSSFFFMIYHVPSHIYQGIFFSVSEIFSLSSIFIFSFLISLGYVRSRSRNIAGPVIAHFLFDSSLYLIALFI